MDTITNILRLIIEPAGGENVSGDATGDNCDQLLKNQLVFQRGASTRARMQEVIRQIQAQRDNCVSELWNPTVDTAATADGQCFADFDAALAGKVGDLTVPRGLLTGGADTAIRTTSGRDSDNNIIVYWDPGSDASKRPADGAKCWMYVSRLNNWDQNY